MTRAFVRSGVLVPVNIKRIRSVVYLTLDGMTIPDFSKSLFILNHQFKFLSQLKALEHYETIVACQDFRVPR